MKLKEEKYIYIYKITNFLKRIKRLLQDPQYIQNENLLDIGLQPKAIKYCNKEHNSRPCGFLVVLPLTFPQVKIC